MLSQKWTDLFRTGLLVLAFTIAAGLQAVPARAQTIAATVNGDPITSADIEQEIILRRILHKSSTRDEAVEDLVADRLKLHEANKYGVDANDSDLSQTLSRIAGQANLTSQTFSAALQKNKASTDIIRDHLHAVAAWNNYVKARNKGMSVTDDDVTTTLTKNPGKVEDATELTLQEIVFVTPVNAGAADVEQRIREAQALRTRFTDCGSGIALARGLPNVAIKEAFRRSAKGLTETARKALEQTPNGHLTTPERSANGVQMYAVCGKDQDDKTTIRDSVRADLITDRLSSIGDRMYKELRATAVVEKR